MSDFDINRDIDNTIDVEVIFDEGIQLDSSLGGCCCCCSTSCCCSAASIDCEQDA